MLALIQHQTWKKRSIATIWAFQIPLLGIDMIVLALLIGFEKNGSEDSTGAAVSDVQVWTIINLVFAVTGFLINCVEVTMYIHSDLSPSIYFWFNVFNLSTWTIPFAYNIYMNWSTWVTEGWNNIYLYVGIGFSGLIYITMIASFFYALSVLQQYQRRSRTIYDKYANESASRTNVHYT